MPLPKYYPTKSTLICEGVAFALMFAIIVVLYCVTNPPERAPHRVPHYSHAVLGFGER